MMQINDDYYERLTEDKVDRILADLRTTGTCCVEERPVHVARTGRAVRLIVNDSLAGNLHGFRTMSF